jgi:hypothetical protein
MAYNFHQELSRIWEKAVSLYMSGKTDSVTFPISEEITLLASWGITKMDLFDYAEDWCLHREPDLLTFILVHYERWSYFIEEQKGQPSSELLDSSTLPAKTACAEGIVWLPRILPKARAKLRGELPPEVMYGCGGDRQFFQHNQVHPAEFLRVVRRFGNDDNSVFQWVAQRRHSSSCLL